ncbi:putative palmitoyltransferase ZDHHC14 [Hypsizygus marmoreus]|uniref:Palmitoyltransferase n=1 Tax=Hypsizygus marmoreus TaxID=39966 RepID=A0A369JM08_HYPMA|nr:putative palmitoyltransferase ZDHHC14 [Hypsizygus marmoreus]
MNSPTRRNSLPLPPSLNAPPPTSPRSHGGIPVTVPPPASNTASPISAHFPHLSIHSPPSTTHAGGIQPSSLFFHPARPALQPQYSPQPSLASNHDTDGDHDGYPLAPLPKRHSIAHSSIDDQDPAEDPSSTQLATLKRIKQSREPLLPIGGSSVVRRPSVSGTTPSGILPPSLTSSPRKPTAAGRVRTSLDRVFGLNFSHGMSFDSMHTRSNSTSTPYDPNRLPDEERADLPYKPPSSSPIRFLNSSSRPHSPSSQTSPAPSSSHSPTPPPSFIATPPTPTPEKRYPLSATPILKPGTSTPLKKYHLHPSRNHFFLGGRLLTGGDSPWAFIASLSLVIGLSGLWFSTTCVFWWRGEGGIGGGGKAVVVVGAYLAALVISTMLATATTDPGILPRGLDPDPPYPATSPSDGGVRAPMPRDLRVRNDTVRVKYCPTCKTYRPPRSSHCKMCDNCVDGCDHHCQWVNNCIGRRNYTTFFALLCFATTTLVLIIVTSALHLYLLTRHSHTSFRHALSDRKGIGSAVVFALGVAVVWPVAALLGYHLRLLVLNVTTIEMLRNQAHKSLVPNAAPPPNPFSHGTRRRNFAAVLCRPPGYSWLDAGGGATEDGRGVNPGVGGEEGGGGGEGEEGERGR